MTEGITKQLTFSFIRKQKVTVDFEGGEITSDFRIVAGKTSRQCFAVDDRDRRMHRGSKRQPLHRSQS